MAILDVNLNKIRENLKEIRKCIGRHKKINFVVKANAYGMGMTVAKLVEPYVNSFSVFNPNEGEILRNLKVKKPILCFMASTFDDIEKCILKNLQMSVFTENIAYQIVQASKKLNKKAYVHIKINSGMNRFGVKTHKKFKDIENILKSNGVQIEGVFTHFHSKDDINCQAQVDEFNKIIGKNCTYFKHITFNQFTHKFMKNFAGIRSGINIVGDNLNSAISLKGRVINIQKVNPSEFLGYDFKVNQEKPIKVGIIDVGYGDVSIKKLTNCGYVFAKGKKYDIIGNIAMDVMFIKIDNDIKLFDEVEVIGNKPYNNPFFIADKMGTISYEVLTSISQRVERNYIK